MPNVHLVTGIKRRNMKALRKILPKKLYKYLNKRHREGVVRYNLVKLFTENGFTYSRFPKEVNMPLERFAMSMALLERLSCGLSGEEMDSILTEMEKEVASGLSNPKSSARVAAFIHVIRERQNSVVHKEILLNIAATWIVRDDEDPHTINAEIHSEKVSAFEKMCSGGAHDFFTRMGIEPLMPLISISPEEFQMLWEYNVQAQRKLTQMIESITFHRTEEQKKFQSRSKTK